MFSFLDSFTLICGGGDTKATNAAAVPEEEANSIFQVNDKNGVAAKDETLLNPADSMDTNNYLVVELTRPMGILFEENINRQYGGAFVVEINERCSAAADGSICRGDQLVAIGEKRVSGMDFDDVMKLILDDFEEKTKLTLFRGPAESLYGPFGASIAWLDEFVAERGEEAALVEEEESESDLTDVAVRNDLLDVVAVAALDADVLDELNFKVKQLGHINETFEAYQTLLDVETNVEKGASNIEEVQVVADKEDDADSEVVISAEDVHETHEGDEVDLLMETTPGDDEVTNDAVPETEVANDAVPETEVANDDVPETEVTNDAVPETEKSSDAVVETDSPVTNEAVNKASKDWLDNYLANPELVSNQDETAEDMVGESADLEARSKKATEVKEAALAVDIGSEKHNNKKGILKESKYSPRGVDDFKAFEFDSNPVDLKESLDDDSVASSVWSEPEAEEDFKDDMEDEPAKRVGSSLAAMGVASTLIATNVVSA